MTLATTSGGCHCGRVKFQVTAAVTRVLECNCSICSMTGYLHWIVPRDQFHLETPESELSEYRFNTGVARHMFCRHCGIKSWYVPRSDPDKISVNARCLRDVDLRALALEPFDGANWEEHFEVYRRRGGA